MVGVASSRPAVLKELVRMFRSPRASGAQSRPSPSTLTARRLAEASLAPNTGGTYGGKLRRLRSWIHGRQLDDASLAASLAALHDAGRAPSSTSITVATARVRARLAGEPSPGGELTARILADHRRSAGDRGRGQTRPFGAEDLAAVLATCHLPRRWAVRQRQE